MVDIRRSVSSTFLQLKPMGRIMPITEQQLLKILPNAGLEPAFSFLETRKCVHLNEA